MMGLFLTFHSPLIPFLHLIQESAPLRRSNQILSLIFCLTNNDSASVVDSGSTKSVRSRSANNVVLKSAQDALSPITHATSLLFTRPLPNSQKRVLMLPSTLMMLLEPKKICGFRMMAGATRDLILVGSLLFIGKNRIFSSRLCVITQSHPLRKPLLQAR